MSGMCLPFAKVNLISAPTKTKTHGILALTKWKIFYTTNFYSFTSETSCKFDSSPGKFLIFNNRAIRKHTQV